jgi:hypothetical protein
MRSAFARTASWSLLSPSRTRAIALAATAALLGACASLPGPTPAAAPAAAPASAAPPRTHAQDSAPPADVNLQGYPLAFRQGYADGCESARRGVEQKSAERWSGDAQYRQGWSDGRAICAARR